MGRVVVKKKGLIIWNIIAFNVLSILLMFVIEALSYNFSALRFERFTEWLNNNLVLNLVFLLNFILLFTVKSSALIVMGLSILFVALKATIVIYEGYSKGSVLLLALYLPLGFIFFQFLKSEIKEAYVDSGYSDRNLFEPFLKRIAVSVLSSGSEYNGWLSNWSSESCFAYLKNHNLSEGSRVTIKLSLMGKSFEFQGVVVSYDKRKTGVGLRVQNDLSRKINWSFFISKLESYGFSPKSLR